MNRPNRRHLLLLFLLLFFTGALPAVQAQTGAAQVRDSLAHIYPSARLAGGRIIVSTGKYKALFSTAGRPLTPFSFTHLEPGLDGNFLARPANRPETLLLSADGAEKALLSGEITLVDAGRGQYVSNSKTAHAVYDREGRPMSYAYHGSRERNTLFYDFQELSGTGKWGVCDTFGRLLMPAAYDAILGLSQTGIVAQRADTIFSFSPAGKLRFKYRADDAKAGPQGSVAVKLLGLWALKDSAGRQLTEYKWSRAEALSDPRFLLMDNELLNSRGERVLERRVGWLFHLPGNWTEVHISESMEKEIRDENFELVFAGGSWARTHFVGNRFIHLYKEYNDVIPKIWDRRTRSFTHYKVEQALTDSLYVVYEPNRNRRLLKEGEPLPLPPFTGVEALRDRPYFLLQKVDSFAKGFLETDRRSSLGYGRGLLEIERLPEAKSSNYGLIDSAGKLLFAPEYAAIDVLSGNLVAARKEKKDPVFLYTLDAAGVHKIKEITSAKRFPAYVQLVAGGKTELLDTTGTLFFSGTETPALLYADAKAPPTNALPPLMLYDDQSGYGGLYNLAGEQLLPHQYYEVTQKVPGMFSLKKGDSLYFANIRGKLLFGGRGFGGKDYKALEGYAVVTKNERGNWGMLGANGQPLHPFVYTHFETLKEGVYVLGKPGAYSVLQNTGGFQYPPQPWKPLKQTAPGYYLSSDSQYYHIVGEKAVPVTAVESWVAANTPQRGSAPNFLNVPAGQRIPPGIYTKGGRHIWPNNFTINFSNYQAEVILTDSLQKGVSVADTSGAIIVPPSPTPIGIILNPEATVLVYKNGRGLLFRRQKGSAAGEKIRVDSVFDSNWQTSERGEVQVGRYKALTFTGATGGRNFMSRFGTTVAGTTATRFQYQGHLIVQQGTKWGLLNGQTLAPIYPTEADSIVYQSGGHYAIYQSGLQGAYFSNTLVPPLYIRLTGAADNTDFMVVAAPAGHTILDRQGRQVMPYVDSLAGGAYSLLNMRAYLGREEATLSVTDSGTVTLLRGAAARIKRRGIGKNYGYDKVVILGEGDKLGLWSNEAYTMVLPFSYDAIESRGPFYVAWKYKADKHEGIDSTLILNAAGKIILARSGALQPVLERDFFYPAGKIKSGLIHSGQGKTPVYSNTGRLIVPADYTVEDLWENRFFKVAKGGQRGLISTNGEILLPPTFDFWKTSYNDDRYLIGKEKVEGKEDKYHFTLVSLEGKILTTIPYDYLEQEDGKVYFRRGRRKGTLDETGAETREAWPADLEEE